LVDRREARDLVLAAFELPDYEFGKNKSIKSGDSMLIKKSEFEIIYQNFETYKLIAYLNNKSSLIIEKEKLLFLDPNTWFEKWMKNNPSDNYQSLKSFMSVSATVTVSNDTIISAQDKCCVVRIPNKL
jgi:hypothetical protein